MSREMEDHRGRRDSEVLRDAEAIRSDSARMKAAMKHLEHARNAMERGQERGLRGKKRRSGRMGSMY